MYVCEGKKSLSFTSEGIILKWSISPWDAEAQIVYTLVQLLQTIKYDELYNPSGFCRKELKTEARANGIF